MRLIIAAHLLMAMTIAAAMQFNVARFEALLSPENLQGCKTTVEAMIHGQTQEEYEMTRKYNDGELSIENYSTFNNK
jgi:hypothetical protein